MTSNFFDISQENLDTIQRVWPVQVPDTLVGCMPAAMNTKHFDKESKTTEQGANETFEDNAACVRLIEMLAQTQA